MQWNENHRGAIAPARAVTLLSVLIILVSLMHVRLAQAFEVSGDRYVLSDRFEYLEDPVGALAIHHLLQNPGQYRFESSLLSKPEGRFTPIWLKLDLLFEGSARDKEFVLLSRSDNFSDLRIYRPDSQGRYQEVVTGYHYVASTRELDAPRYAFDIAASSGKATVYIRYMGGIGTNELPWYLMEKSAYLQGSQMYYLIDVACYAAILALLFFNAILAGAVRKAAYFFYSAFMFSVFMGLLTYDGLGFYYLWPNIPELNDRATHVFNLLSAAFRVLAVMFFLDIAKCAPAWHRASLVVIGGLLVTLLAVVVVGYSNLPAYFATVPWLIASLFGFALCGVGVYTRQPLALPLLITLLIPALAAFWQMNMPFTGHQAELFTKQLAKMGFVVHSVLWSVCLAAQIRLQTESTRIALHDNLTGLPQAALLRERFEWAAGLAKRQQWRIAVLFIDLDGFKAVNDSLGHAAGDRVLLEAAVRMRRALRKTDYVARLGGDEFVVLLIDVPERSSIVTVTRRLLTSISQPIAVDSQAKVGVSASIGVSIYDGEDRSFPELLRDADTAMYEAKAKGKNTYTFDGEPETLRVVEPRLTLVTQ